MRLVVGEGRVLIGEGIGGGGALLTVSGDASITGELRVDDNLLFVDVADSVVGIGTSASHSNAHVLQLHKDTGGVNMLMSAGNYGTNYARLELDSVSVGISAGNKVRALTMLHSNQNVGIGTSAPASPLHVYSTSQPALRVGYNADHYLGIGHCYIDLKYTSYTNNLTFKTNGTSKMAISRVNGGVAIDPALPNEFLPSGALHVNHYGTGIIVANNQITGNAFEVYGAQGNLLTITDDLSDSLMSVNDAAGMPVFEVFADDTIKSYRNNESKFEVDPDNNRIRLRDNADISGNLYVSGHAEVYGNLTCESTIFASQYIKHYGDASDNTHINFTEDRIQITAGNEEMLNLEETTVSQVVVNDGGIDINFRVETDDNQFTFVVDGGDDTVGIGAAASSAQQVYLKAKTDELPFFHFTNASNAAASDHNIISTSSSAGRSLGGYLKIDVGAGIGTAYLAFYT